MARFTIRWKTREDGRRPAMVFAAGIVAFQFALCGATRASTTSRYQVTPQPAQRIQPGTVVGGSAPRPWSHLIIKSHPKVGSGDIKKVSARDIRYASRFSPAVLARVERADGQNPPFYIRHVGVGCLAKINGRDTIITPETHKKLGAKLGFFEIILLKEFCKRQRDIAIVAYSPTMALVDAPMAGRYKSVNQQMVLRYAMLVDAVTGRLDTLVWLIWPSPRDRDKVVSRIQWLAPNYIERSVLHVDASEYRFGIPSENAYAVVGMPRGEQEFAVPESIQGLVAKDRYTPTSAEFLERNLHSLVGRPTASQ